MNEIETRFIDLKVKGKNGFVQASSIQRHRPDCNMIFIELTCAHMLFCQENHPLIVLRDDREEVIEARDIDYTDKIWCETIPQNRNIYNCDKMISVEDFYKELKNRCNTEFVYTNDDLYQNYIFMGSEKYNLCLKNDITKTYTNKWFILLFKILSSNLYDGTNLDIYSFNLVQQLSQVAYEMGHHIKFRFNKEKCCWNCIFYMNYSYNQTLNDYVLVNDITRDISGYQGYVYDIKTDSEEFLNNSVQTHNSFHCLYKNTRVNVFDFNNQKFKQITLEDIWDEYDTIEENEVLYTNELNQYEKDLSSLELYVTDIQDNTNEIMLYDKLEFDEIGLTKITKIIRHKQDPTTNMVELQTESGNTLISQDNHPTFFISTDNFLYASRPKTILDENKKYEYNCLILDLVNDIKPDKLIDINILDDISENDYVYDLTTESKHYFANGILTHNTGGAAEFKKIDILKELKSSVSSEYESYLDRMFFQKDNDLYCNADLVKIVINTNLYQDEYKIKRESNKFKLPLGYFTLYIGELELKATIEMPIEFVINDDTKETDNEITILYGKSDKMFHIEFFKIAPEQVAQKIDKLVAGKSPWENPEDLLKKLHENLSQFGGYDLVHIETIISNILRNKKDPTIPARLKEPYEPETYSIKTLPSVISWSLGIAFENISKSLTYGLISKDPANLSQIEKVLYGEPLSELSQKLLRERK